MSPQSQRLTLAKRVQPSLVRSEHSFYDRDDRRYFKCSHCGDEHTWRDYVDAGHKHPSGECSGPDSDYLNDLNAIHDAERRCIYVDDETDSDLIGDYLENLVVCADTGRSQSATAAQRLEALLKTLNLWN